jgi:hypothetical protein
MAPNKGRSGANKRTSPGDTIPEGRFAWTHFYAGAMSVSEYDEVVEDEEGGEKPNDLRPGKSISVLMGTNFGNRAGLKWILTNFTHAELMAVREIFNLACDLAEPVVLERDRLAQEAFENGDDSHARVYRSPPTKVVRRRQE